MAVPDKNILSSADYADLKKSINSYSTTVSGSFNVFVNDLEDLFRPFETSLMIFKRTSKL